MTKPPYVDDSARQGRGLADMAQEAFDHLLVEDEGEDGLLRVLERWQWFLRDERRHRLRWASTTVAMAIARQEWPGA